MSTDAFIQCRVTPETKALVQSLATREQITESVLVRQLLEVLIRSSVGNASVSLHGTENPNRETRLSVRLDANDRLLLKERAATRGVPAATYVAVLVRSHLRGVTPLLKDELLALDRAVAELSAIGRNLNQIARALNRGDRVAPGREEVWAMLKVCTALRDHIKALLKLNQKSWDQGHAATAQ